MSLRRLPNVLLAGAIGLLVVALIGRGLDVLGDAVVNGMTLAGLGLLAVGQGVRAALLRQWRAVAVLLLVLALAAVVLID